MYPVNADFDLVEHGGREDVQELHRAIHRMRIRHSVIADIALRRIEIGVVYVVSREIGIGIVEPVVKSDQAGIFRDPLRSRGDYFGGAELTAMGPWGYALISGAICGDCANAAARNESLGTNPMSVWPIDWRSPS